MERLDLETWFAHHPGSTDTPPDALLDQCESEIRDHAKHDAWVHAREIAEQRLRRFERVFGLPASDEFVTREVCHEIARELKQHEPHPDAGIAAEWVGEQLLASVDAEARVMLRTWFLDLAEREEHEAWRSIVRFTDHLARTLIHEEHLTADLEWDFDRSYPKVAARVVRMMIDEFDRQALRTGVSH